MTDRRLWRRPCRLRTGTQFGVAGFGIQITGGVGASDLNDGEFIMAGHNGLARDCRSVASPEPGSAGEIWCRYRNSVADAGFGHDDAGLGANWPNASYQLLYSDSAVFSNYEILDLDFTIDGNDTISFSLPAEMLINGFYTLGINAAFVPEPSSVWLMLGLLGGVARRRGRNRSRSAT